MSHDPMAEILAGIGAIDPRPWVEVLTVPHVRFAVMEYEATASADRLPNVAVVARSRGRALDPVVANDHAHDTTRPLDRDVGRVA